MLVNSVVLGPSRLYRYGSESLRYEIPPMATNPLRFSLPLMSPMLLYSHSAHGDDYWWRSLAFSRVDHELQLSCIARTPPFRRTFNTLPYYTWYRLMCDRVGLHAESKLKARPSKRLKYSYHTLNDDPGSSENCPIVDEATQNALLL